jgi:hypothetical protein
LAWIVRKECWVPKPFHDSKKSVSIYLDDPLSSAGGGKGSML